MSRVVPNKKSRREEEAKLISEQEGKVRSQEIIRFLHGITVTQLRNLYAGNLHFDPGMQKVETLEGTTPMVI